MSRSLGFMCMGEQVEFLPSMGSTMMPSGRLCCVLGVLPDGYSQLGCPFGISRNGAPCVAMRAFNLIPPATSIPALNGLVEWTAVAAIPAAAAAVVAVAAVVAAVVAAAAAALAAAGAKPVAAAAVSDEPAVAAAPFAAGRRSREEGQGG
eukprot:1142748-Pelagomonas_calceolata.AAC.1